MPVAQRLMNIQAVLQPIYEFATASSYARRGQDPNICDFAFGNPHEMPLAGFVSALQGSLTPQNKDWYAYKNSEPVARKVVVQTLRERYKVQYEEDDIHMTNGAFAALAVSLHALVNAGDEVIFISPPWFFYESLILSIAAMPVRVKVNPQTFDLDLEAIAAAITPKTRAIIINSPNNPTGKIYPPATLQGLAQILNEANHKHGSPIYLLSDEAYNRIVFDGRTYPSPTSYYDNSLLLYTYGKTLLTPGQRIGYIALPPNLPERGQLGRAIYLAQMMIGWSFPNALLQHALPDLEKLSIDIEHLQEKRDRLVHALREFGYSVHLPEGTFYLMARAPIADDTAFTEMLGQLKVFCLPGTIVEMPGYFRISLTANDTMIDQALPAFKQAFEQAKG